MNNGTPVLLLLLLLLLPTLLLLLLLLLVLLLKLSPSLQLICSWSEGTFSASYSDQNTQRTPITSKVGLFLYPSGAIPITAAFVRDLSNVSSSVFNCIPHFTKNDTPLQTGSNSRGTFIHNTNQEALKEAIITRYYLWKLRVPSHLLAPLVKHIKSTEARQDNSQESTHH